MKRAAPYFTVLIFVACAYIGFFGAVRGFYKYRESTWFSSLGTRDAAWLRETGLGLLGFEMSSLSIQNSASSIQINIASLSKIRAKTPQEVWPVLAATGKGLRDDGSPGGV